MPGTLHSRHPGQLLAILVSLRWWLAILATLLLATGTAAAQERRALSQNRAARPSTWVAGGGQHSLLVSAGRVYAWGDNGAGQLGSGVIGGFSDRPMRVSNATGMTGVVAVAAGSGHSVALDSRGVVWTWGDNSQGQLGDGTGMASSLPVPISPFPGLAGRVVAIAAGGQTSFALTVAGEVWAWGDNFYGQLGDGTVNDRWSPLHITGVVDVKQVAAGIEHTLALDVRGRVWAWGRNDRGQVGNGTNLPQLTPTELFPGDPFRSFIDIAGGGLHSLCIEGNGDILAWGGDPSGQLGNGAVAGDQLSPVAVSKATGLDRAVRVTAGALHSMALTSRGRVYAWGADVEGQLGLGSSLPGSDRTEPALITAITGLPGATALAAGDLHSLALQSQGRLLAWGANTLGQVGNGSSSPVASPVRIPDLTLHSLLATAAAWKQSYILRTDGSVWSWGDNGEGQLGDGTVTPHSLPRRVDRIDNVIAMAANTSNVLALRSDGTVWGWGKNQSGQMGLPPGTGQDCPPGNTDKVCRPLQIGAGVLNDVKAIAAGTYFHLVLRDDGSIWSWGANANQQLGRGPGPDDEFPGPVPGVSQAISVAGGGGHSLALLASGSLLAWGRNGECELGIANCCAHVGGGVTRCSNPLPRPDQMAPTPVAGVGGVGTLGRITAIDVGLYHHTLALDVNGRVLAWGDNLNGQLGDGNSGPFWVGSYPDYVRAPGGAPGQLQDIQNVAAGGGHSVGVRADGMLFGWGLDAQGQLGDGLPTGIEVYPQQGATEHLTGGGGRGVNHTVVRRYRGGKCASGLNDMGQLGDGTTASTHTFFCDASAVGRTLVAEALPVGRFTWDPVDGAADYTVYRGSIVLGTPFAYNHACTTPGGLTGCPGSAVPCPPEYVATAVPATPGRVLYYVVSSRDALGLEDHLGRASFYTARPNPTPCP